MIHHTVAIGDVIIEHRNAVFTCFGLGSCIGLFINDRDTNLSAAAHILLPDDDDTTTEQNKFYTVTSALHEILNQFRHRGSTLNSLRAKITGGANVVNLSTRRGCANVTSVMKHLIANRIFVAAHDVGGVFSRTVKYDSLTGQLTVKIPELNNYKFF